MSRRLKLTQTVDGRWRKIYRGKQYHFRGEYKQALQQWEAKKVEIDSRLEPEYVEMIEQRKHLIGLAAQVGANDAAAVLQKEIALIERVATKGFRGIKFPNEPATNPETGRRNNGGQFYIGGMPLPENASFIHAQGDILYRLATTRQANPAKTAGMAAEDFLKKYAAKEAAGKLSAGRFDIVQRDVHRFRDFLGNAFPVEQIGGQHLEEYHNWCLGLIESGKSSDYVHMIFRICKQFVMWCYETELLPSLPRNFHSPSLRIEVSAKKISTFPPSEFQALLAAAPDQTELFLLLMANCGMTQVDVASLRQREVDWRTGRIRRKRSKTANHESVPEVDYKLWPRTFALLKKYRSEDVQLVLTQDGKPLRSAKLVDRKVRKVDVIANAYKVLTRELKLKNPKPLKLIRKTGASLLGGNSQYATLASYYLGHAPRSVADKHYVRPSRQLFDKALGWLAGRFLT